MRESNAIFPEIKYDLRKCLECDDIFTPAYRHPHQKFCKNPICCHHRDARRKSLSHQHLMRNPAYHQALSQRKSREYYHRKNLRTLRQAPEQAPEIRPSNSGERAVVISSFFKSNTLQAPENSYTHSKFFCKCPMPHFFFSKPPRLGYLVHDQSYPSIVSHKNPDNSSVSLFFKKSLRIYT